MVINSQLFGNLAIIFLGIITIAFIAYGVGRMFGVGVRKSLTTKTKEK